VSLLAFEQVDKSYEDAGHRIPVLDEASFDIEPGETLGVRGSRGAGKSTLLSLAAGHIAPDRGIVRFKGRDLARLTQDEHALLWRKDLVMVAFEGQPRGEHRSVVEHVVLPLLSTDHVGHRQAQVKARRALERADALNTAELSLHDLCHEELLRVELARALVREPTLLLVDEPPVLRSPSRRTAFRQLLRSLCESPELAVILVSEDLEMLQGMQLRMSIGGGQLRLLDSGGDLLPFRGARAAGRPAL
jgi:ABC-type lipoprotein export system ATPase subunit